MNWFRERYKSTAITISRIWIRLTGGWAPYVETPIAAEVLTPQMLQNSTPSFGFFFMLALAAAIATFGLIANSAPAIIGAMIVAPLMAPIVSLAYGLVIFNRQMISLSIVTVIAGAILVVVIADLSVLLVGTRVAGSEILSRTSPTLLDLGVALAAGGAGAFAHTRRGIANSIAGVAIAVALVPPLAVVGIGLALGSKATSETGLALSEFGLYSGGTDIAFGAFLLFLTNLVGIVVVAMLVFLMHRYGVWKKAVIALGLFIGLSLLLIQPLNQSLHEIWVKNRALRLVSKLAVTRPDIVSGRAKIESVHVAYINGLLHINMDGFVPKDTMSSGQETLDRYREILEADIGEPVVIEMDIIPVEMVQIRSGPAESRKSEVGESNKDKRVPLDR